MVKKKSFSADRPSLFGKTIYKDVMSIEKITLSSAGKLKERKLSKAWLLSLIKDGNDLTMGAIFLTRLILSYVGQLHVATIGQPWLFGF